MRFYKYCNTGGIEILRGCSIKVALPSEVNDPFDCNPTPDITTPTSREALRNMIIKGSQLLPKIIEGSLVPPPGLSKQQFKANVLQILDSNLDNPAFVKMAIEHLSTETGLLCLSVAKNHHLMWAHYADSHKGLVIEFDWDGVFSVMKDRDKLKSNGLHEVRYSDERPFYRFDQINPSVILTKGTVWSYEEEWRVVFLSKDVPKREVAGQSMLLLPIPPTCIKAVYLGNRMTDVHCQEIGLICNQEHLRHVDIYQMQMSHHGYSLTPVLMRPAN